MSPAVVPALRIPVGVVVERRKADSTWIDFVWRGTGVLPDEPKMTPWTVLREQEGTTLFYAGSATVDLYRSETARYRDNVASGAPSIWIVLTPSGGARPYAVSAVTADPAEGEAFTEAGDNLVDAVPMPETLREAIECFVAEHHVDTEFVKRERRRADPEALARRYPEGGTK
ncbi:DUF3305 domain-containing protein [Bradyrhizobium sp. ORS 86]|uniref:DUF3305 domain-containing protein n=1 Tax=Bradyrhizobium sp. ORS 86 TaxID=1685970 RepID=UPI00388D6F18